MRLKDRVCIITGAGSGMGRVAAELFALEGAKIAVLDLVTTTGEETAHIVRGQGGDARFFHCDVADEDSVKQAVAQVIEQYGTIDVLYNNAGIMPEADHSVIDTTVAIWDLVMAVNVRGIFLMCKHVIPTMQKQGRGSIINIASFVALVGCSVPQDAYTASKGALISLTKSLAIQFRPMGIRANVICPGPIETPLLTEWLLKDEAATSNYF
jgi:NAD(P)-dependent dehydrogenase (short-subunit alcohol dehydrogenase family)